MLGKKLKKQENKKLLLVVVSEMIPKCLYKIDVPHWLMQMQFLVARYLNSKNYEK